MLRLFLRLYLILVLAIVLAIYTVSWTLELLYAPAMATYSREAVRGQLYALVEDLLPLDEDARTRQLEEWRPHYGLGLALVLIDELALNGEERQVLERGELIMRDDFNVFVAPVDGLQQRLLRLELPKEPSPVVSITLMVNGFIGLLVGLALFVWVRPHWRDIQRLRDVAERVGRGDLSARAVVSRRSDVHQLAEHFNQMSARLEQLLGSQRELTQAVSHELRTPISRLAFELRQLQGCVAPEQRQRLLDDMRTDLQEMEEMVAELLTYARLEQPHLELQREPVEAGVWLDSVLGMVALEAEEAGIDCRLVECQAQSLLLEPRFMARALINLLRNAIRYAERRIEVRLTRVADDWQLLVSDDGPGIPLDACERVFEPFSRLDESRNRDTGGFGLGLAIVQRIAQWHGGRAHVEPSALGGSAFAIRFPAA